MHWPESCKNNFGGQRLTTRLSRRRSNHTLRCLAQIMFLLIYAVAPATANADNKAFLGTMVASLNALGYSNNMTLQHSPLYPQRLQPGLPNEWTVAKNAEPTRFSLSLKNQITHLSHTSLFVMPGETAHIEVKLGARSDQYDFRFSAGRATAVSQSKWRWTAPLQPGLTQLLVSSNFGAGETKLINAFVMVPATRIKHGKLEGYQIGHYPKKPKDGNPKYLPPSGFIRVTEDNQNTLVSPHFRLKQFLCKQAGGFPKFVVLEESLLYKLEHIVQTAKAKGFPVDTLHVMSGYRTPFYNKAIGNGQYSRHQWGDAADIFIDIEPTPGVMDDLNADHKHDIRDAQVMASWINNMRNEDWYQDLVGGLGIYKPNSRRGAFIHVDVRGHPARW